MPDFAGKTCVALSWTKGGLCFGVLIKARRRKCRIVKFWRGDAGESESLAEALEGGRQQLGAGESRLLAVGGMDPSCGFADVDIPRLRPEELRNALGFELNRVCPASPEKLSWGFRILPGARKGKSRARIYFLRQTVWEDWLQAVSALDQGVDVLIPPLATLDPLLDEHDAFIRCREGQGGFVLSSQPDGRRSTRYLQDEPEGVFGAGKEPLALSYLELGPLAELPPNEQREFAPVVMLGMYALGRQFLSDRETILAVPYELRPKRYRVSRFLAAMLFLYVLVMGALGGGREYAARSVVLKDLIADREEVEAQVQAEKNAIRTDTEAFVGRLREEMKEAYVESPSMPVALLEITRLVPTGAWCQFFDWKDGNITVQLSEEQEDEELIKNLEFSPVIGDVIQISKAVGADSVITRKLEMTARYDVGGETRPPTRPKAVPDDRLNGNKDGGDMEEMDLPPESRKAEPAQDDHVGPEGDVEGMPGAQGRGDDGAPPDRSAVSKQGIPPPPPPPPMGVVPPSDGGDMGPGSGPLPPRRKHMGTVDNE